MRSSGHTTAAGAVGVLVGIALAWAIAAGQAPAEPADLEGPRQFDFWIGEWDVRNPDGALVGQNSIRRLHGGRVLEENWKSVRGGSGMSLNFYDPERERWRQVWVDSQGGVVEYEGAFEGGAMRMDGSRITADGVRLLTRAVFRPMDDGTVWQFLEESADGGETWGVYFEGTYHPREEPAEVD